APTAVIAEGFVTALYVLGLEEGMALIDRTPGVEAVILTDYGVYATSGIMGGGFAEFVPHHEMVYPINH
ncbi:MAG: FAD:protein FMN transferase, partial [Defluviitaleaceae bacterium]|nr:FAD:protein FMN transferase [Defluviitaleaceae bacterium]